MRTVRLLAENITVLLKARHQNQHDLAQWCHHSDVWLSYFLSGKREIQFSDLDRMADFFGLAAYQLFQPGISRLSERRSGVERRAGQDRRIGQTQREMLEVRDELDRVRSPRSAGHEEERRSLALPAPIPALIRQLAQHLDRLSPPEPRRQTPRARQPKSKGRVRDRADRGSDAPSTD